MTDENTEFHHEIIFENEEIVFGLEQDLDSGNFDFVLTNNSSQESAVKAFTVTDGEDEIQTLTVIDIDEAYSCLANIAPSDLYEIAKKLEAVAIMAMAKFTIRN